MKKYLKSIKKIEKEISDTVEKLKENKNENMQNLLHVKSIVLEAKYIEITQSLLSEYKGTVKESIKTIIRSLILNILSLIILFVAPPSQIVIASGLITIIAIYNVICFYDIAIDFNILNKAINYAKNSEVDKLFNISRELSKKYQNSKEFDNKQQKSLDNFKHAYYIINNFLYEATYEIPELSPELEEIVVKILQYDLNSKETDYVKLLIEAKKQTDKSPDKKILTTKNK